MKGFVKEHDFSGESVFTGLTESRRILIRPFKIDLFLTTCIIIRYNM